MLQKPGTKVTSGSVDTRSVLVFYKGAIYSTPCKTAMHYVAGFLLFFSAWHIVDGTGDLCSPIDMQ